MQGLAPTHEQGTDTGSETSSSSVEQLEHVGNELMDEIFGNDEIDVPSDRRQFLINRVTTICSYSILLYLCTPNTVFKK